MIVPIECYTCKHVLEGKWGTFIAMQYAGYEEKYIWEAFGVTKDCCKLMFYTHVDLIEKLLNMNALRHSFDKYYL